MQFILLTHSREVSKSSNTGRLVQQVVAHTQTIIWQRTQPDIHLLKLISAGKTALLYPTEELSTAVTICDFENFILIDSTWQEARKIYNRSPYLQNLPKIQLTSKLPSKYSLRRNQIKGGMCTAECSIELLRQVQNFDLANELECVFQAFIA